MSARCAIQINSFIPFHAHQRYNSSSSNEISHCLFRDNWARKAKQDFYFVLIEESEIIFHNQLMTILYRLTQPYEMIRSVENDLLCRFSCLDQGIKNINFCLILVFGVR